MAADLTTLTPAPGRWATKNVAMDATAGNVTEVSLPAWATHVHVYFTDSSDADEAGKVASSGTDGAAIGSDYFPVPSGNGLPIHLERVETGADARKLYLAGSSNSGKAKLLLMRMGER